ncbi:MAG: TIGR00296 family protein [Conexivisphaerales archaeon]
MSERNGIVITLDDGKWLVKTARRAAETFVAEGKKIPIPDDTPAIAKNKMGVFVTIKSYPKDELRGCIGRPEPNQPLIEALIDSAIDSATRDPRFDPMSTQELKSSTFEVSVLTPPHVVEVKNPLEYKNKIVIGRDGLIVEWSYGAGLLLPQVPVEEGWDIETYLSYACMKAGAHPDYWLIDKVRIYSFQAIIFYEEAPGGEVRQRFLAT